MELIAQVGLALAILVYIVRIPYLMGGGAGPFLRGIVYHGWPFLLLLGLTAFTRTVPLRMLVAYWFVGAFPVLVLSIFFTGPLRGTFSDETVTAIFVPIIEEVLKALPVLFYFWWSTRGEQWERTVSDGLLLGFVVGAGFAFHEDVLWGRSAAGFLGDGHWLLMLLFPFSMFHNFPIAGPQMHVGHAGWTAIAGVGIGLMYTYRHHIRAWFIGASTLFLVTLDHATWNSMIGSIGLGGSNNAVINLLAEVRFTLLLDGKVIMFFFVIAIMGVAMFDWVLLRPRADRTRREFPSGYELIRDKTAVTNEPPIKRLGKIIRGLVQNIDRQTILYLHSVGTYTRWRRSGLLAARQWDFHGEIPETSTDGSIKLLRLRNRAIYAINVAWSSTEDALDTKPYHYYVYELLDEEDQGDLDDAVAGSDEGQSDYESSDSGRNSQRDQCLPDQQQNTADDGSNDPVEETRVEETKRDSKDEKEDGGCQ